MKIFNNFSLNDNNAYHLDATCAKAFFPSTSSDFIDIFTKYNQVPKIIIGDGNNIILSKKYYNNYFVIINECFDKIEINNENMIVQSGATLLQLSNLALEHSLSGLEVFYDIPSSLGGAVVMNAGAYGEEIKDIVLKVKYLDLLDLRFIEKTNEEIDFTYRNSFFQNNKDKIVLKVWLSLKKGNKSIIKDKMDRIKSIRWEKQPRDYPNCGSVFKRPGKNIYVGPMMDELDLKGYRIGDAMVSKKHSGFIVNVGNATGDDILNLIKSIQKKIKKAFNIDLEIEQRII